MAGLARRFNNAGIVIDAGGPGEAAAELLERHHHQPVTRVTFTNQLKEQYVNATVLRFEQGRIRLVDPKHGGPYRALIDELTAFERRRTDAGLNYSYSAPEGEHDDCVTALMLAFGGDEPHAPFCVTVIPRGGPFGDYSRFLINTNYGD